MKIAVFSDVHGKVLLPFKLVDLYQQETGEQIDLILQCGDLGAYPNLDNLDKATIKHAQSDRDELGFHDDFTTELPEIKALLDRLDLNMYCVRGNHEDHDFLDDLEHRSEGPLYPIDVYERVFICKSGLAQVFTVGDETLRVLGIGRIGDRKGRSEPRFIQDYEREALKKTLRSKQDFDVLLTHDKDNLGDQGYGMQEIRDVLDRVICHYHFYGHTGQPFSNVLDDNGITRSVKVRELEFERSGVLPEGCFLILEKNGDGEFALRDVEVGFTNRVTKFDWRLV